MTETLNILDILAVTFTISSICIYYLLNYIKVFEIYKSVIVLIDNFYYCQFHLENV